MNFRWDFKTHNNDIKFGVRAYNSKTGEKFNEVDLKRVEANEAEETGFITCQPNHKCNWVNHATGCPCWSNYIDNLILDTVLFDNSYSYFKSKKITYSVVMVETPLVEIENSASKIEEQIFDHNENDISQVEKAHWCNWIEFYGNYLNNVDLVS